MDEAEMITLRDETEMMAGLAGDIVFELCRLKRDCPGVFRELLVMATKNRANWIDFSNREVLKRSRFLDKRGEAVRPEILRIVRLMGDNLDNPLKPGNIYYERMNKIILHIPRTQGA